MILIPRCPTIYFGDFREALNEFYKHKNIRCYNHIGVLVDKNAKANDQVLLLLERIKQQYRSEIVVQEFSEPSIKKSKQILSILQNVPEIEAIFAIGGGSTIDMAKIVSILLPNRSYQLPERFRIGIPNEIKSIPIVVFPTTIGSGAELSPAAIYTSNFAKVGIIDEILVPKIAVIIPEFAKTLNTNILIPTLVDGFVHSFEGLLSVKANDISNGLHSYAFHKFLIEIPKIPIRKNKAYDFQALCEASLASAFATRITGVNIIHTVASIIGYITNIRHGISVFIAARYILKEIKHKIKDEQYKMLEEMIKMSPLFEVINGVFRDIESRLSKNLLSIHFKKKKVPNDFIREQEIRLRECVIDFSVEQIKGIAYDAIGFVRGNE